MIRKIIYSILFLNILLYTTGCNAPERDHPGSDLASGFSDPPVSARPKGYWCWVNGNFDLRTMEKELKEFKDKGMGGVDIWDVAGWVDPDSVELAGPPFLGEESVQAIGHAVRLAKKLGLEMGLTLSSSWNAGGSWVKPQDGVQGLFRSVRIIRGPATFNDTLPFPVIPSRYGYGKKRILFKDSRGRPTVYKEVAVLAYPLTADSTIRDTSQIINLSAQYHGGRLTWEVPPGRWAITRYVNTGTGQPLVAPSPRSNGLMIDHFSAGATRKNLEYILKKLKNELGDLESSGLKYLYTDSYEVNSAVWTKNLEKIFRRKNGYSMIPFLPVLDGFTVADQELSSRFLHDFKKTLSDLIIRNHYLLSTKICAENGLDFHAESGGPGPPLHNCPFESLSALGAVTVPRGEFWYRYGDSDTAWRRTQVIKGPASAAHLYNQPQVEAEAFTSVWLWQYGPGDLKEVLDRAFCEGLNRLVYHTSPHIVPESGMPGWVYNFGTLINTTRAWWPLSRPFHTYIARCSYLLQQGNFVGDVLFYYGDEAPNFVKPKHYIPSLGYGYDYDITNSDIILHSLDVKDGKLTLPNGQQYEILVLPDTPKANPEVLKKIETLVKKGAWIVGNKPERAYGLRNYPANDRTVRKVADKIWGTEPEEEHPYGKGMIFSKKYTLKEVLIKKGIAPDVEIVNIKPSAIDFIHRSAGNTEIYFLRNTLATAIRTDVIFRTHGKHPEIWDPDTGIMKSTDIYAENKAGIRLPVSLSPYGSVFIIFRNPAKQNPVVSISYNGKTIYPDSLTPASGSISENILRTENNGTYTIIWKNGRKQTVTVTGIPGPQPVEGRWEVRFPAGRGAPKQVFFDSLISWTRAREKGIRYFSGIASYRKTFTLDSTLAHVPFGVILDLGTVSKIARIYINGREIQTCWHAPYVTDITAAVKPGKNFLVIDVANVLSNMLTGDASVPEKYKRTHTNITRGPNAWMWPWKEVPLIESGLLGPVKLHFYKNIKLDVNE